MGEGHCIDPEPGMRRNEQWRKRAESPHGVKRHGEVARAPLIFCPQDGSSVTKKMKGICNNFARETNNHVKVVTRGGRKLTRNLKSNPL